MQPGTYSLERSLEDCVNHAIQKAVKNPCGIDPFGSELRAAMDTFASSLPSCLQKDRITTRETLPASRKVTVTSVSNEDQNKKSSHPLISSVNQGVLVLNQPIFYTVKKGDTLSEISWKLTGRKASVRDLKNWNTIWDDHIKPGQVLYLADPYDPFVKEIASKLSKYELTGRTPKISLDRLSDEMVAQHGGLFDVEFQVEILLEYPNSREIIFNPFISGRNPVHDVPWPMDYSGGNKVKNSFDQPLSQDQVGLNGGYLQGSGRVINDESSFDRTANWAGDHAHQLGVTVAAGLNAYAGFEEVKAGIAMIAAPTGVTQIAGAYAIGDGIVRMVSAPIQIYGTWTGNNSLENSPHNLLGTVGFLIDSGTVGQWTTGGPTQIWMGIGGDFGLSRMKLIQMATKGFNNPNALMRMKDIGNAGWQIIRPYKDAIQKGLKQWEQ